jgi:hypothetical protein
MGLAQKQKEFEKFTQRLAMQRVVQQGKFEGTYSMTVGRKTGVLTIANIGSSNFVVGLCEKDAGQTSGVPMDFSFFHVVYNAKDDTYEAHRFAVDSPEYNLREFSSPYLKFSLKAGERGNSISGTFYDGLNFKQIRGSQVNVFKTFQSEKPTKLESLTGSYRGSAGGKSLEVNITQVGQRLMGTFAYENRYATVFLNYGYYNPQRNMVYLTSGELPSYKWVQIRGEFLEEGNVLQGVYIIGGHGEKWALNLRKVR